VSVTVSPPPDTRLTGRRLTLGMARGACTGVATLALRFFVLSIPLQFAYYGNAAFS
jgi:hypothetical protein